MTTCVLVTTTSYCAQTTISTASTLYLHVGRQVDGVVSDKEYVSLTDEQRPRRRRLRSHIGAGKSETTTCTAAAAQTQQRSGQHSTEHKMCGKHRSGM